MASDFCRKLAITNLFWRHVEDFTLLRPCKMMKKSFENLSRDSPFSFRKIKREMLEDNNGKVGEILLYIREELHKGLDVKTKEVIYGEKFVHNPAEYCFSLGQLECIEGAVELLQDDNNFKKFFELLREDQMKLSKTHVHVQNSKKISRKKLSKEIFIDNDDEESQFSNESMQKEDSYKEIFEDVYKKIEAVLNDLNGKYANIEKLLMKNVNMRIDTEPETLTFIAKLRCPVISNGKQCQRVIEKTNVSGAFWKLGNFKKHILNSHLEKKASNNKTKNITKKKKNLKKKDKTRHLLNSDSERDEEDESFDHSAVEHSGNDEQTSKEVLKSMEISDGWYL